MQLKEQLAAESAKLKEADEVNSRLREDLKKKDAELEAMKIDMIAANNALLKALEDILAAEQKQKVTGAKLMTLRDSVHRFVSSVFGKAVRAFPSLIIQFYCCLLVFCFVRQRT